MKWSQLYFLAAVACLAPHAHPVITVACGFVLFGVGVWADRKGD